MENVSPLEDTWPSLPSPLADDTRSSTAPQIPSQGYTAVTIPEELKLHSSTTNSSARLGRDSTLSDSTCRAASEDILCDIAAKFDYQEQVNTAKSATDSDETLQSRSHFRYFREIVIKFWLWEAGACVLSLMCLASIVGILAYEDGKLLDQWEWSVPPTAVVSFIGTLGKASTFLVLSQVLSQMKWLHFRQTRSLRHVRIFDGASRGPLGAVLVIWDSQKLLASVAACLMILTILVDPFVQLVFVFPSKLVEDDSQQAFFSYTTEWIGGLNPSLDGNDLELSQSQRITASIYEGLISNNITTTVVCPSGNCSWPGSIKTLGVCGSCSDATMEVTANCSLKLNDTQATVAHPIQESLCSYTYNNGQTIQAHRYGWLTKDGLLPLGVGTMWNSTAVAGVKPGYNPTLETNSSNISVQLDGRPVVLPPSWYPNIDQDASEATLLGSLPSSFLAIQVPFTNDTGEDYLTKMPAVKCWNCSMYWCEKSFEAVTITDNSPPVYTVSSQPLSFVMLSDDLFYGLYYGEVRTYNEKVWNFRYRVDSSLDLFFTRLFSSYYLDENSLLDELYSNEDAGQPDWLNFENQGQADLSGDTLAVSRLAMSEDLNATIHAIADSLTESIRTVPSSSSPVGQTFILKSYIHVRWAWLALPLALVMITCALLVIVAVKSHSEQVAVWKDDPLALLFHSVNGANILPGGNYKTGTSDLDNLAAEVYVKLDRDRPFNFIVSPKRD